MVVVDGDPFTTRHSTNGAETSRGLNGNETLKEWAKYSKLRKLGSTSVSKNMRDGEGEATVTRKCLKYCIRNTPMCSLSDGIAEILIKQVSSTTHCRNISSAAFGKRQLIVFPKVKMAQEFPTKGYGDDQAIKIKRCTPNAWTCRERESRLEIIIFPGSIVNELHAFQYRKIVKGYHRERFK
jgi:hypothetical protein